MCHDHGLYFAEQSGLILAEDVAYEELINVTPTTVSYTHLRAHET